MRLKLFQTKTTDDQWSWYGEPIEEGVEAVNFPFVSDWLQRLWNGYDYLLTLLCPFGAEGAPPPTRYTRSLAIGPVVKPKVLGFNHSQVYGYLLSQKFDVSFCVFIFFLLSSFLSCCYYY